MKHGLLLLFQLSTHQKTDIESRTNTGDKGKQKKTRWKKKRTYTGRIKSRNQQKIIEEAK
jgi:hypothetical protein